jgi:hypothetical protein
MARNPKYGGTGFEVFLKRPDSSKPHNIPV